MEKKLPNGFILKLKETCGLGMKGALISTHRTESEAEQAAKSLGFSLSVFEIQDVYGGRVLTARA
ncbi:hypothetical protein [Nitrosomonas sp.]|uniref:hypothetical protein n=1 Tax=Nitrosomonas sp. TaxID=42353 RepID=UPI00374C8B81